MLPPAGSFFHDHIQCTLSKAGIPMPRCAAETLSAPVMHGLIGAHKFIGFSTWSVSHFNPLKPLLVRLNVNLPGIAAPIGAVTLKDRPLDPLGQQLIDKIKQLAASGNAPAAAGRLPRNTTA